MASMNKYLPVLFLHVTIILGACGDKLSGEYNIPDEYRKYLIDTTITSFEMSDQNGISYGYMLSPAFGMGLSYFKGHGYTQEYQYMYYVPTMGSDSFWWNIWAMNSHDMPSLRVEWSFELVMEYEFPTKKIINTHGFAAKPQILLQDTITINHQVYNDIVIINIPEENLSDRPHVPFQTIVGGGIGPLQFSFTNGLIYTRK